MLLEKRTIAGRFELRADDESAPPMLEGYASVFDTAYQVGPFTERVARGAFNRTLAAEPDVRLLIDHEGQPLARTKSGTLSLTTDDTGLKVRAELDPSDPDVQRLVPKMRRGDMDQMSFAFRVAAGGDTWDYTGDQALRTLTEISLIDGDVSVVTYPASKATSATVRDARHLFVEAASRELRSGRELPKGHLIQLRMAMETIEREARMSANDTFAALQEAVSDAYNGDGKFAYVEDYDEARVYFTLYNWRENDEDMYGQAYSLAADGMASLTGDAGQVRRRSTYVPVTDPDGDQTLTPGGDGDLETAGERSAEVDVETREEEPQVSPALRRADDARRLLLAADVRRRAA